jgi:hypothetical protein
LKSENLLLKMIISGGRSDSEVEWVVLLLRPVATLVWPLLATAWPEKVGEAVSAKPRHSS